jgi:tetratricopeptide (TPR) repeat protein
VSRKQLLGEEEEAQVRQAIERKPDAPLPRARLALHCWRRGDLAEALEWIDSCLEIDPGQVDYYRIRANIQVDMRQSAKAVETAQRAIGVLPESVMAHLLTTRMLLADLHPARAQSMLDKALKLNPDCQHLELMKALQSQIVQMTRQAEHDPVNWLKRKLQKRLENVAVEERQPA